MYLADYQQQPGDSGGTALLALWRSALAEWHIAHGPCVHGSTSGKCEPGGQVDDFGARFMSPLLGRILSADSIVPQPGAPQSVNHYAYARNSPLVRVDPSGHAD